MTRRLFLACAAFITAFRAARAQAMQPEEPIERFDYETGRPLLTWRLPRNWTLDHLQDCVDQVYVRHGRIVRTMTLGSFADRRHYLALLEQEPRPRSRVWPTPPELVAVPIFVNERLGSHIVVFEVE